MQLEDKVEAVASELDQAGLYFGHGTDNAFDEAVWLVLEAAGLDPSGDEVPWQSILSADQCQAVDALLARRIETHQPLAYLVNRAWFGGRDFFIDSRAIVPRSHIGEWILERFTPWRVDRPLDAILDLCTGSGCIAVSLALAFPEAKVDASDISAAALEVAAINVERHGVGDRVRLVQGDLFSSLEGQRYDLIVCNPPYVSDSLMRTLPHEYNHEPTLAFAGGNGGLDFITPLLYQARAHLSDDGLLVVEAGSARDALEAAWPQVPFTWLMSMNDDAVVFVVNAQELEALIRQAEQ
jgi:ribosomal protein L3 glutamine methyltransferase